MERRTIAGFEAAILGLGTSRLASMGAGRSRADAQRLFNVARDCGINFLDTADTYGSTAAERWTGELTAQDTHRWIVTTKTGLPTVDLPGPFRVVNQPAKKLKQALRNEYVLDPKRLRRRIERSLNRLRRERIEIFLLHLPPSTIVNEKETWEALQSAQKSGLIAEFGVSSDDLNLIRGVHGAWGSTCVETAVNPSSAAGKTPGALVDFEVIANHVM
ncbi:aldo/keto reductase [Microbacterium invictum]|uniref:Aryl-alcohol dehydrogenase-like predicted oxidoreductase n=1 Tax=Microbacterium invictum TaxID=515415 RepID=A0AA40SPH6_9MICO|nr:MULTISPECIES: aldo/keto reductase [Microbacterium]MBB4140032.1 aryl-alcohol dehydrogenase-like predicted oxidoreductase [Microbacterium invictum]